MIDRCSGLMYDWKNLSTTFTLVSRDDRGRVGRNAPTERGPHGWKGPPECAVPKSPRERASGAGNAPMANPGRPVAGRVLLSGCGGVRGVVRTAAPVIGLTRCSRPKPG